MKNNSNLTKQYQLNIYIENEIIDSLKQISKKEHRKLSEQIRFVLKKYTENYFDTNINL